MFFNLCQISSVKEGYSCRFNSIFSNFRFEAAKMQEYTVYWSSDILSSLMSELDERCLRQFGSRGYLCSDFNCAGS